MRPVTSLSDFLSLWSAVRGIQFGNFAIDRIHTSIGFNHLRSLSLRDPAVICELCKRDVSAGAWRLLAHRGIRWIHANIPLLGQEVINPGVKHSFGGILTRQCFGVLKIN